MRPILKSIGLLLRLTTIAQQLGSTAAKYKISAIILSKFPQSAATQKYSNIYYWWTADNSCRSTMWKRVLWTGQCDMHSGGREREQSPDSRNSHSNNPFPFPVSQVSSVDRWPATWTELQNKSIQIVLERRTTICYSIKTLLCHSFYWQLDNFGIDRQQVNNAPFMFRELIGELRVFVRILIVTIVCGKPVEIILSSFDCYA